MFVYNLLKTLYFYIFVDKKDNFPTGLLCFCGRQGSGKTISAVRYIYNLVNTSNDIVVFSNCSLSFSNGIITDISDLFYYIENNKDKKIIFFIDEIQNSFSSSNSKNFDENILSIITQQRKQKIHIVATSQVFTRMAKPLREQCYTICNCKTILNRLTVNRFYFADDYLMFFDDTSEKKKEKLIPFKKNNYFQTDFLRGLYDTYELIKTLSKCKQYKSYENN